MQRLRCFWQSRCSRENRFCSRRRYDGRLWHRRRLAGTLPILATFLVLMRRGLLFLLKLSLIAAAIAAIVGWLVAPWFLHPIRRELPPDLVRQTDVTFSLIGAHREDFEVRAPDGALLRGWRVRPAKPNGDWVLAFHGVADNRLGVVEAARILLMAGYGVVMMDARAHGLSEGPMATYGW